MSCWRARGRHSQTGGCPQCHKGPIRHAQFALLPRRRRRETPRYRAEWGTESKEAEAPWRATATGLPLRCSSTGVLGPRSRPQKQLSGNWRWRGRVRGTGSVYNPCYNPWVQPVVKTVQPIQPVQGVVYLNKPYSMVVWVVQFLQRVVPRVVYRTQTLVELGG